MLFVRHCFLFHVLGQSFKHNAAFYKILWYNYHILSIILNKQELKTHARMKTQLKNNLVVIRIANKEFKVMAFKILVEYMHMHWHC